MAKRIIGQSCRIEALGVLGLTQHCDAIQKACDDLFVIDREIGQLTCCQRTVIPGRAKREPGIHSSAVASGEMDS
ncbi:hypothetical protein, partial [Bradyrhizobium sp. Leo170]|uniref:hypothetical protein n=1 Tax=Bradyrhizobium sp. Leo170 TaxID=1571199 RepID=UPI001A91BD43